MKIDKTIFLDLLDKWIDIFGTKVNFEKTFAQNGGWETQGSKLLSFIHSHFKISVKHEEMMETTLGGQLKIIQERICKDYNPDNLCCIKKKDSCMSLQQKAIFEEISKHF
jgi:hypothetical protein